METLTNIILSFAMTLATIVMAIFTWQQHKLNKSNYKLQLFDKRYRVYKTFNAHIEKIKIVGTTLEDIDLFEISTEDAQFLFNDARIHDLREEIRIYRSAVPYNTVSRKQELDWCREKSIQIENLFLPYLLLDDIQVKNFFKYFDRKH